MDYGTGMQIGEYVGARAEFDWTSAHLITYYNLSKTDLETFENIIPQSRLDILRSELSTGRKADPQTTLIIQNAALDYSPGNEGERYLLMQYLISHQLLINISQ